MPADSPACTCDREPGYPHFPWCAIARQAMDRAMTGPEPASGPGLLCPACGSDQFQLWLGGKRSGQVSCSGCGLAFNTPEP